ncbi:MAG TPA: MFS transporter [Candidatus Limnocylindria bacterium]|nr:MFS transporter [Candidatus Limnocylindria bacterium]
MRVRRGRLLAAFEASGYRWLVASNFALWAAWTAEALTQGWLVLQLTDSPFWVGLVGAARGVGQVVFSVVGGTAADRFDRKRLVAFANVAAALISLALAALVAADRVELWHIVAASAVGGMLFALNGPTFSALTFDVVGGARILNATAFYFMGGAVPRIIAALAGGLLIDRLGLAPNFALVFVLYVAAAALVLQVRRPTAAATAHEPPLRALLTGLRYVGRTPAIRGALVLSLVTEVFGFAYLWMLPVVARDVLVVGASGLGFLTAAVAGGQLVASLSLASVGDVRRKGRLLVTSAFAFGVAIVAFALTDRFAASLVLAFVVGSAASTYDSAMAAVLQVAVSPEMRGRVLGLYVSTWGASQVGGLIVGALATGIGVPLALALSGAVVALNALRANRLVDVLTPEHARPLVTPDEA